MPGYLHDGGPEHPTPVVPFDQTIVPQLGEQAVHSGAGQLGQLGQVRDLPFPARGR